MPYKYDIEDGKRWKKRYEDDDMTFEQIALDENCGIATVRMWAKRAGVETRRPGDRSGSEKRKIEASRKAKKGSTGVRQVRVPGSKGQGKRRRSKY